MNPRQNLPPQHAEQWPTAQDPPAADGIGAAADTAWPCHASPSGTSSTSDLRGASG